MESSCSLISLDVYDWLSDLKQIDLNDVEKTRRCELLLVAEKSFAASARLKTIERCGHARDVHVVTLSDVYDFLENRQTSTVYVDASIARMAEAACREAARYAKTCDPIPTDLLVTLVKLKTIYVIKKDVHEARRDAALDLVNRIFENPPPPVKKKEPKSKKKSSRKPERSKEDICSPYLIPKTEEKTSDGAAPPEKVLYVALMGFYMADVFEHLASAGMTLSCVIEINERHASSSTDQETHHVLAHKHYNSQQFGNKNDTLYTFWSNLYDVFFRPQAGDSFIVTYTPMVIVKNRSGDGNVASSQQMFEHFAEAVRRIDEYRTWHRSYLEKLKVFGLGETPKSLPVYCMDVYNDALDELPIECVNVEIVLEGLLGEVCHRVDNLGRKPTEEILERGNRPKDFRSQLKRLLAHMKTPPPSTKNTLDGEMRVLHERNFLERNLRRCGDLRGALLDACEAHLKTNACAKLWEKYPATRRTSANTAVFNKQLEELCPVVNLNARDLLSCIVLFLFGKIDCAAEDKEENKDASETFPNRNDDLRAMLNPVPEVTGDRREGTEGDTLNAYEQLLLHRFAWIEDLPAVVLLQELDEARSEFECFDHIYVPVFDSVHLHFHHGADRFGIATSTWGAKIRSPVDLNTFLTYVVHEDTDFVVEEQKRREELERLYQEIVEKETRRINRVEIADDDFIMKGSIKDQLRGGSQVDEREAAPEKGKKKKDGESKKGTKSAPINVRSIVEDLKTPVDMRDVEDAFRVRSPPRHLHAYDFEGRTAITGSTTAFYSLDPMKIVVSRHVLTGEPPRVSVNVTVNGHAMTLHAYVHRGFDFRFRAAKSGAVIVFGREAEVPMTKLQDVYLLNEKRIRSIKCVNRNLVLRRKLLVRAEYLRQIIDLMGETTGTTKSLPAAINSGAPKISRGQFLGELKRLGGPPRFKIRSTRLHKYSQVRRVASPAALEPRRLREFLSCRDDCERHRLVRVKKCFPIPGATNPADNYDLRVTLENGLQVRSVPGNVDQFYVKKGPQHATEESRTFLRCGFTAVKHLDGGLTLYAGDGRVVKFGVPLLKRGGKFQAGRTEGDRRFLKVLRRLEKPGRRFAKTRGKHASSPKTIRYDPELSLLTVTDDDDLSFVLVTTDGKRIRFKRGKMVANACPNVFKEEDIRNNKTVYRREDGTQIATSQDGHVQVTYADGTRITNWFEVSSETLSVDLTRRFGAEAEDMGAWVVVDVFYRFEHPNYVTVTCSSTTEMMKLEMPEGIALERRNGGEEYVLKMDGSTTARISKDTVQVESLPCEECNKQCRCTFNIARLYQLQKNIPGDETLLTASDTYGKSLAVNYDGSCSRNDDYDQSESNCDHVSHKKQNLQAFFVMKRDFSGRMIWTDQMYEDRKLECQLSPNQRAVFYADQVDQTAEFRVYEKEKHHDRFLMPTLEEPHFDFESAVLATRRLLQAVPDFRISAPIYVTLMNQLLASEMPSKLDNSQLVLLGTYLATKSDFLSLSKAETAPVCKRIARNIFSKKIAEWKRQCKLGRQAVVDFRKKPQSFYDFDLPSEDRTKTTASSSSSTRSDEENPLEIEELSVRSMGTNTLVPFCVIETELTAQGRHQQEEDPPASRNEKEDDRNKLLDRICDILRDYGIQIDEDGESTTTTSEEEIEEQSETTLKTDGSESDASSVPEFLKGATYRAVYKLFTAPASKKRRAHHQQPLKYEVAPLGAVDSIVTHADSWFFHEQTPLEKTLSMKVLSSKVTHHPSYSDAELILKMKSSETRKLRLPTAEEEADRGWEGITVGITSEDLSRHRHHCRDCLGAPFIKRGDPPPYERKDFLD